MSTPTIQYLTTGAEVQQAAEVLQAAKRLAVDLEFDDMRHRYGRNLALIQIYDGQVVYLLDPLPLTNPAQELEPIWVLLRDPAIEKVFHSCKSDILLLDEIYGVHVRNILDTSVQYTLLGESDNNISLGRLIQAELGLEVDKGEQKSNWLKRPLTEAQKVYAANDVLYLFELTDRLAVRLQEQGRAQWAQEENQALEAVRYGRDELRPHLRLAGKYRITPAELPLFRELYALRDRVARQLDRPSYMVLSNDRLAELTRMPIASHGALRGAGGLHPDLKRAPYADELVALATADLAPDGPLPADQRRPQPFRRRFNGPVAARAEARETLLQALKNHLAADYSPVLANTVLSNRLIGDVVEQGSLAALRPWQRQLLGETASQHGLPIADLDEPLGA